MTFSIQICVPTIHTEVSWRVLDNAHQHYNYISLRLFFFFGEVGRGGGGWGVRSWDGEESGIHCSCMCLKHYTVVIIMENDVVSCGRDDHQDC